MLAMNYRGPRRVRCSHKPMPEILHPQDAIVRVTRSCICGSDLHLYNGAVPDTRVGHDLRPRDSPASSRQLGDAVQNLKVGDHVLVPFNISCGKCVFCRQGLFGNCHESNPQATAVGGIFGYSHTAGGYDGGQAEYVRVPYADVGPMPIPGRHGPGRCGDAHRRGADRLPGGRDGRHPEGRHGGRLRRRPDRHHGRALRLAVRRRPGDRHRPRGIPARLRPPLRALRGLQLRVARRSGGVPEEDHRLRSAPTSASTPSAPRPPATRCRRCSAAS